MTLLLVTFIERDISLEANEDGITVPFMYFRKQRLKSQTIRLSPTTVTQNTRLISRLDSATGKGFNNYFWSSPTTRPKRESFYKWVSKREDTHIWIIPLLTPKMGLPYRYSVWDYRYSVGDPFWIWVSWCASWWRQPQVSFCLFQTITIAHELFIF
jgi:hypothetical protein